jgi:polar amino acid transport system substrate-binding protein
MKKILFLLMALVLVLSVFAGCSSTPAVEEAEEVVAEEPAAEEEVAEEEVAEEPATMTVLKVAIDDTYPPMEYVDANGETVGFDIDLAKALGEEMGVEVEFISTAWDSIFAGLAAQQYDCIISSVSMTTDRMATMDFSAPYLANGQVIVVKPDEENITTQEDLAGKMVGVQFATTADEAAGKIVDEIGFELVQYDDMTVCLTAMKAGQIDCMVADMAVAIDAVAKNPESFKISSAQLTNEPIAIAVDKGNTELLEKLNAALTAVQTSGKASEISVKHLGEDYTRNIDTELR